MRESSAASFVNVSIPARETDGLGSSCRSNYTDPYSYQLFNNFDLIKKRNFTPADQIEELANTQSFQP